MENEDVPGYEALRAALEGCYDQAARGKGENRHAVDGSTWLEQPIFSIPSILQDPKGFHLGQAIKKIQESVRLSNEQAKAELRGAVVYLCAAIVERSKPVGDKLPD